MKDKNGFVEFLVSPMGKIVLAIVLYAIIFGIEYALISAGVAFPIIAVVLAYFGWQALDMITPDIFLIMPLSSWLWYWLIKGILSIFIGLFVAPYQIAKMIVRAVD